MRAADRLITHFPHARKRTDPGGAIVLEDRSEIRVVAPAELVYTIDCFRDTRLTLTGHLTPGGGAQGDAQVELLIDGSVVWQAIAAGGRAEEPLHAELPLDAYDVSSRELLLRCSGKDAEARIVALELSFEKELPDAAKAGLVDPVTHQPLRYSTGQSDAGPGHVCAEEGRLRFSRRRSFDPAAPASLHPYPPTAMEVIERHSDGLVLDYGAGLPSFHFRNVVTADIVDAPGIDVVLDDERLPFADGTFDAVLSLAVLEHVPNPFRYGRELLRVLKLGGELYVDTAFIQHYHGWPHHYFNSTQMGLRQVFRNRVEELGCGVHSYQSATLALNAVMADWLAALPPALRTEAEGMPLREFIAELRGNPNRNRFTSALDPTADQLISAGVYFHARKVKGARGAPSEGLPAKRR